MVMVGEKGDPRFVRKRDISARVEEDLVEYVARWH